MQFILFTLTNAFNDLHHASIGSGMEDPQREITGVIHLLTQSPPSIQQQAIEKYFVSSAEFIHPFCRTGTFDSSRFLIRAIYRWYKILSPRIDLKVNSIGILPVHTTSQASSDKKIQLTMPTTSFSTFPFGNSSRSGSFLSIEPPSSSPLSSS